jgi:GGDEF domain-containing protein
MILWAALAATNLSCSCGTLHRWIWLSKKAENIGNAFRRSRTPCGSGISGSIGISFYPYDGSSYNELFCKADAAMYAAKKNGKDSFRVYTREIEEFSQN